jgi:predicted dinucleotide-binding enzyme
MSEKIGIIGSGQVARVLATGFAKHGHPVLIGSGDVKKLQEWKAQAKV